MAELGIDISKQTSKGMEQIRDKDIDVVVSVCKSSAKVACLLCSSPILGGRPEIVDATLPRAKHYLNHSFSDPSEVDENDEEKVAAFRRTRRTSKSGYLIILPIRRLKALRVAGEATQVSCFCKKM